MTDRTDETPDNAGETPPETPHTRHSPPEALHARHSPPEEPHARHSPPEAPHARHSPPEEPHARHSPPEAPHARYSLPLCRKNSCIVLLGALILLYLLAGAAMFSALEAREAADAHRQWREHLKLFRRRHNISHEEWHRFLVDLQRNLADIDPDSSDTLWDFPGAFYFVTTVVSTIGFGMSTPATTAGKIFLIFYGVFGCSATILFINLFLERVSSLIKCCLRLARCDALFRLTRTDTAADGLNRWSLRHEYVSSFSLRVEAPSVDFVALNLIFIALLLSCCASAMYSYTEGWTFLDSFYFSFVAFSTIGFGDLVPCQRAVYQSQVLYQVANLLCIFLGVCCVDLLFNAISILIWDSLNLLLASLENYIAKRRARRSGDLLHSDCHLGDIQHPYSVEKDVEDFISLARPSFVGTPVGQ